MTPSAGWKYLLVRVGKSQGENTDKAIVAAHSETVSESGGFTLPPPGAIGH
jgi:hypothetical protein